MPWSLPAGSEIPGFKLGAHIPVLKLGAFFFPGPGPRAIMMHSLAVDALPHTIGMPRNHDHHSGQLPAVGVHAALSVAPRIQVQVCPFKLAARLRMATGPRPKQPDRSFGAASQPRPPLPRFASLRPEQRHLNRLLARIERLHETH